MIEKCPSCGGEIQPLKHGKFFCEPCDAIFAITREGPKVERLAPLEDLRQRVSALEARSGPPYPESPEGVPGPDTGDSDIDADEAAEDDDEQDEDEKGGELWPR